MKAFFDAIYNFFFLVGISSFLWLTSLIVYSVHYELDMLQAWYFHELFLFFLMVVDSAIVIGFARYHGLRPICPVAMACFAIYQMWCYVGDTAISPSRLLDWLDSNRYRDFHERQTSFLFCSGLLNLGYLLAVLDQKLHAKPVSGEEKSEATSDNK